ncbi:MAG: hypothetical protein EHM24_30925 [Acidobacteria bacterium]|nr:MAG: hypothetical protein EHM24_30925 [Acidobacteriota bacterium]
MTSEKARREQLRTQRRLQEWATKNLEGLEASHMFSLLWSPSCANIAKQPEVALRLAAALLLDKPITILAPIGSELPKRLLAVAAGVEYYTPGDMDSMKRAMIRVLAPFAPVRQ